ncbi:MAG: response regulator [Pseudanabaenaceae cyanobacterium bins.39]|nr:response regulator [Pseudanabaenaceae cyanobacterium bins.39]
MDTDSLAVYSLLEQLRGYSRKQFTGKLEIHTSIDIKWNIYYCHGRLVWAVGGEHHYRRWYRIMAQNQLQVDLQKLSFRTHEEIKLWEYHVWVILMKRNSLTRDQITPIIEQFIQEVMFDIIQWAAHEKVTYYCDFEEEIMPTICLIHAESAFDQAYQTWMAWRKAGIADFSPNLAPWIKRPDQLKEETSELTYKTLVTILDGRRSLRELSVWLKRDLFSLVQSLMTYYYRGMVGLMEVADIDSPVAALAPPSDQLRLTDNTADSLPRKEVKPLTRPLIACVDDSNQVCATMEQIIESLGFGFLGIREAIRVLPILVEQRPEMIILDLVMPIVSGYELCKQIRRIPEFKDTPILILTSNDTLVDRLRTKLVGATAFISKTSSHDKIGKEIAKYISN